MSLHWSLYFLHHRQQRHRHLLSRNSMESFSMHTDNGARPLANDSYDTICYHLRVVYSVKLTYVKEQRSQSNSIIKIAQCFETYMISDLPAAIAHVAGPNLAPRFKNT